MSKSYASATIIGTLGKDPETRSTSSGKKTDDFVLDEKMVLSQLRHLEERRTDLDQAIEELRAAHRKLVASAR